MRRRTADAGKELARRFRLPKEMVELCTTGSAYHVALRETVTGREDLDMSKFLRDVEERFAEVRKELGRVTSFGSGTRKAISADEVAMEFGEEVAAPAPALAAPAPAITDRTLRVIEGDGESRDITDLVAHTPSGTASDTTAAPLASQSHAQVLK